MTRSGPRRDWFWLWVLGSLAAHAAALLAAPIGLPRAVPKLPSLQLSLAPREVIVPAQDSAPVAPAPSRQQQPSPARHARVSAAPRREKPTQPTEHATPVEATPQVRPADPAEESPLAVDGLWGKLFTSVPSAGGAVSMVDAMCGSTAEGDAPNGADTGAGRDAGAAGAAADGDGRGRVAAPVGQSLPRPAYPEEARRRGEEGEVRLRVLVGADGYVARVLVVTSSGHERLDAAAREATRRWRFQPARRGGEPIRAWVELPVKFRLEDPS